MALSVCVSPSVTSRSSIETAEESELVFLACELPSTCRTVYCYEIQESPKISVLLFGTSSQTPVLESFHSPYRLSKRVIDLAR